MGIKEIQIQGKTLTIYEHDATNDSTTGRALTGSWLWHSSLYLSHWLQSTRPRIVDFTDKTVLELGAGTGLPGLTAAVLGASRVVLTDIAPILEGLRRNVEANGLGDRVEVRELVWGLDEYDDDYGEVDVVLMSDVFYAREEMEGLARTLRRLCGEKTRVLAASEVRGSTGECLEVLREIGFQVEVEATRVGCDEEEEEMFAIYEFRLCPEKGRK